eukprot:scaffold381423_cov42-Prasinocladus_malaysianus.AAC.1
MAAPMCIMMMLFSAASNVVTSCLSELLGMLGPAHICDDCAATEQRQKAFELCIGSADGYMKLAPSAMIISALYKAIAANYIVDQSPGKWHSDPIYTPTC